MAGVPPKLEPTSIVEPKEAAGVDCLKMLPPLPWLAAAAAKPPAFANEEKAPPLVAGVGVAVAAVPKELANAEPLLPKVEP